MIGSLIAGSTGAQSQNFDGFGIAFDYSLSSITDKSLPGGAETSRSGMPGITGDYYKAIADQWLVGAYGTYDLATTDTAGSDPDAHHPTEAGGKLAYAFNEKLMAYVKLGYSWSRFSAPNYYQRLKGPSYGMGAEYLLMEHLFARVEVSQQNYKTITWNDGSADKVNINSYSISLGWRF